MLAKHSEIRNSDEITSGDGCSGGGDGGSGSGSGHDDSGNYKTQPYPASNLAADSGSKLCNRNILLFCLACKDFYNRLSDEQKNRFRAVFAQCDSIEFKIMLDVI